MAAENQLEIVVSLRDRFTQGIREIGGSLEKIGSRVARVAKSFLILQGVAAGLGVGIAYSFTAAAKSSERFTAILKTLTGSAEKAEQSMAWISDFATKTPYELSQVTDAFVKLKAYGFDPTSGSLKTLGDTAAGMGKGLMQAVEMFADAATGEFERLKEFGIRAKQEGDKVTFSWIENGIQMTKTTKKVGTEITKTLEEILSKKYASAMDALTKTFGGMWSNILDHFVQFQKAVMSSGIFDYMKAALSLVLNKIDEFKEKGKLDEWAKNISNKVVSSFESMAVGAAKVYDTIAPIMGKIKKELTSMYDWYQSLPNEIKIMGVVAAVLGGKAGVGVAILLEELYRKAVNVTDTLKALGHEFAGTGDSVEALEVKLSLLEDSLKTFEGKWSNWTPFGTIGKGSEEEVEKVKQKIEEVKQQLEGLKNQEGLKSIVDVGAVEKDVGFMEKATRDLFNTVKELGRSSSESGNQFQQWMAKSSEEFIKFGEGSSEAFKKAKVAYFDSLDSMIAKTTQAYEKIRNEVDSYAKKVLEVEKAIALIRMSTADRIRDLSRRAMTDEQSYYDERRQAEEKLSAASKALQAGDIEAARRFAKEAEGLYSNLAREVTTDVGGKSVVTQSMEESVRVATEGIQRVGDLAVKIEEVQKTAYQKMGEEATVRMDKIKEELDTLVVDRELLIEIKLKEYSAAQNRIDDLVRDETKHVTVEVTEKRKAGGIIKKYAQGGIFSGYGGGDKISVLAEAGEGFVRKEAIQKYGHDFFNAYNSMKLPLSGLAGVLKARIGGVISSGMNSVRGIGFQGGGIVSDSFKNMGRIEIAVGSNAFPVMADANVIEELRSVLTREKLVRMN